MLVQTIDHVPSLPGDCKGVHMFSSLATMSNPDPKWHPSLNFAITAFQGFATKQRAHKSSKRQPLASHKAHTGFETVQAPSGRKKVVTAKSSRHRAKGRRGRRASPIHTPEQVLQQGDHSHDVYMLLDSSLGTLPIEAVDSLSEEGSAPLQAARQAARTPGWVTQHFKYKPKFNEVDPKKLFPKSP